jgi:hypothetical protein
MFPVLVRVQGVNGDPLGRHGKNPCLRAPASYTRTLVAPLPLDFQPLRTVITPSLGTLSSSVLPDSLGELHKTYRYVLQVNQTDLETETHSQLRLHGGWALGESRQT